MAWMETIVLNRQWMSEKKAGSEPLSDRALLYGMIVYPILYINSIFCMVRSLMPVPERAGPETDFSFRNSSDRNGICVLSAVSMLAFLQLLPAGPAWRLPGRAGFFCDPCLFGQACFFCQSFLFKSCPFCFFGFFFQVPDLACLKIWFFIVHIRFKRQLIIFYGAGLQDDLAA